MKKNYLMLLITALVMVLCHPVSAQIQNLPKGMTMLNQNPTTSVKSQDKTGTCWSFSATSFIESEILKQTGKSVDISEMFTVRNIYIEKAQKYLRYQGTCQFSQGSLAHDVFYSHQKYGMMPETAYPGKAEDSIHNHTILEKELKEYLDALIAKGHIDPHWKDGYVTIMDMHLGVVPAVFTYNNKSYNAQSFAKEVIPIKLADYVGVTSFTHQPFNQKMVVEVPDNFSNGLYYNLPINEMIAIINRALSTGYTIEWDGDVSEKGFVPRMGYAVYSNDTNMLKISPEKCAEEAVSQELRQAQFDDYSTMDDHLMHITGMVKSEDGRTFYVVKNSWGSNIGLDGYLLMSEAYLKMKTVSIYVNRNALPKELSAKIE